MIRHIEIADSDLRSKIKQQKIRFGGNMKLKIYGTLFCKSGKRMKRKNRVFFLSESEAVANDFRPCGHCMKEQFQKWKNCNSSGAEDDEIGIKSDVSLMALRYFNSKALRSSNLP